MPLPSCKSDIAQRCFRFAFWLGVALFVFGQVVDFLPGYQARYQLVDGILLLLLPGVLLPRWPYRTAAVILVLLCVLGWLMTFNVLLH